VPIELDNNATTRPEPQVVEAMTEVLREQWHNPSSVHRGGQAARYRVEQARRSLAELVGAMPRDVVFTSGATEALDLAIRGLLDARPPDSGRDVIVTTAIEHEAVRDLTKALDDNRSIAVRHLPLNGYGVIETSTLANLLDDRVALVCAQWANNETGAIQPVEAIGRACRERRIPFVCDATQWVGKMPTKLASRREPEGAPIDAMAMSAHKFHGPKGVGALLTRSGLGLKPRLLGTQERERRGGTENVPGIVGMGVAGELAQKWLEDGGERERLAALRDRLERTIVDRVDGAQINGPTAPGARLWNTTNIAFPALEAEAILLGLSEQGLHASAGAACSSGSLEPSPVLLAMGVPERLAHGSIRFSLSRHTTEAEVDEAIETITSVIERVSKIAV
jgi:cysteine desulfurase